MLSGAPASHARGLHELLRLGRPPVEAKLEAVEVNGALRMRGADGTLLMTPIESIVRWSTPAPLQSSDALLLTDGSILALVPAWSSRSSFTLDNSEGEARTRRFGRIDVERSSVAALLLKLPRDEIQVTEVIDKVQAMHGKGDQDQLLLDNGDIVSGKLRRIGNSESNDANNVSFEARFGPVELPIVRIRAVVLADEKDLAEGKKSNKPSLTVGLDDGSRIAATSIATKEEGLVVSSPLAGPLTIDNVEQIAYVQTLGGGLQYKYLSNLEPASYRHEPYLELPWTYRRDRNALGQPLRASDRVYLKGLGMHSTSRLAFDLPGGYATFAAAFAIDNAAEGGGSVTFHVRLAKGGLWREVWSSGIVRGGEPPRPVRVALAGAEQLDLVVERADRGDERDYANWPDARLERAE